MDSGICMVHLDSSHLGSKKLQAHREVSRKCDLAAQETDLIENRAVVILAVLDPSAALWRPLLQGLGLTVFNGFHCEGLGDQPVILVSDVLWRQPDWRSNLQIIRQQFPGGVLCVLGSGVSYYSQIHNEPSDSWNDARSMLLVAGIDFFTVKGP